MFRTNADQEPYPPIPGRTVPASLRSRGTLDLRFVRRGSRVAVADSYQAGCLRMRVPRRERPGDAPCAVLVNTAGGLAEGDGLEQRLTWDEGAVATVTSQAAEKVYRALFAGSTIDTAIAVAANASAEWLPQETILFDRARLVRRTQVRLEESSTFLAVEATVLGRSAMGEVVAVGYLADRMRIWRGGRLIYAEALVLDGAVHDQMRRAAVGGGARAMAVVLYVAPDAATRLQAVREALAPASGTAAASSWNGLLAVRMVAKDGEDLRRCIADTLAVVRGTDVLPRVWRC